MVTHQVLAAGQVRGIPGAEPTPGKLGGNPGAPAHVFHDRVLDRHLEAAVGRGPSAQHGTHTQLHLGVEEVVEDIVEEEVLVEGTQAGTKRPWP